MTSRTKRRFRNGDGITKNGIDTTLSVDTVDGRLELDPTDFDHVSFIGADDDGKRVTLGARNLAAWGEMAHYCFLGKGAPEHCQIVLQLAAHWNLATTGLQDYANGALGLDCNGFVGNYLWHIKQKRPWRDLGLANLDTGPDALISGYFDNRTLLDRWDALDPVQSYIMAQVKNDDDGIIPGGPGSPEGHIVITDPHTRAPRKLDNKTDSFAVWAVESTAAGTFGLQESWYSFVSMRGPKVFNINRETMGNYKDLAVKIAQV